MVLTAKSGHFIQLSELELVTWAIRPVLSLVPRPAMPASDASMRKLDESAMVRSTQAPSFPRDSHARSAVDSIRVLDSLWARAYATQDTTFANALFADSMAATSAGGVSKGKQGELADTRPQPGLQMHYFRTAQVEVRMYSGAAIVTGLAEWEFAQNGQPTALRRRYTTTYVRGGPLGWRTVALHLGPAAVR